MLEFMAIDLILRTTPANRTARRGQVTYDVTHSTNI